MKIAALLLGGVVGSMALVSTASAAEVDIFKMNGQYGQVPYTRTADGWTSGGISVDGSGVNQTAFLYYSAYSTATGYKHWRGNIPVEAVTVTGVASMSVEFNTCTISSLPSCGYVNFTVATNEPASGWVNNGVWGYDYGDYIARFAGASQARNSTSSGTILGQSADNTRAWMGTLDDVTIEIQIGN